MRTTQVYSAASGPRHGRRGRSGAMAALLAGPAVILGLGITAPAAMASTTHAAASHRTATTTVKRMVAGHAITPLYSQDINYAAPHCIKWTGTLSWGGNGSIGVPAYIDVEGKITDSCGSGSWGSVHLHWDTIDNPKDIRIIKIEYPTRSANTPKSESDSFATYKDIYLYFCWNSGTAGGCSGKYGPGA